MTKLLTVFYGLALLKILSLYLSKPEFKEYFLYFNAAMYSVSLFFGLQGAIILRYSPILGIKTVEKITEMLNTVALLLIAMVTVGGALLLKNERYLICVPLVVFFGIYGNTISRLRIRQNFSKVFIAVAIQVFCALLGLIFFRHNLNVTSTIGVIAFSFLLPVILFKTDHSNKYFSYIDKSFLVEHKEILKYGIPIVFIGLSNFMMSSIDQYFLNYFGYSKELPAYIANYNIAEKCIFVSLSIITMVFVPKIFNKYTHLTKETIRDIFNVEVSFVIFSFGIIVFTMFFSENMTLLVTNEKYISHSWIIPYIASGALLLGINSILTEVLTLQYKTRIVLFCYLVGLFSNLILNFLVITKYGVPGAIATTILSYFFTLLATTFFVIKEYQSLKLPKVIPSQKNGNGFNS